ncbi:MAG: SDR family oxidoreductase [Burkholderiales bacterium]|nr:SDR family oxidoreductase [Anaerolineae bacterium]
MKTVVITGSTRGIGFGLARAFLERGCNVVISSRQQDSVEQAVESLGAQFTRERVIGRACDVADHEQVQSLWDAAKEHFGRIDIWVNNAALSATALPMWEVAPNLLYSVVNANLTGTIYGCKVAIQGMIAQGSVGGHIYNMEGLGSNGEVMDGTTTYGSTKYGLVYLTKALNRELGDSPVMVSSISPGIVITELLMNSVSPGREEQSKRIFNILADRVETVAPWLTERVLANEQRGARIAWLTRPKIFGRFLTAPFRKRDLFTGNGAA